MGARAGSAHALVLANHGPLVSGSSLEAAATAVEEQEETAKLYFLLRNWPTRLLTAKQVAHPRGRDETYRTTAERKTDVQLQLPS
ncbi:class II aldolase/adducin family protein [Mycolicibacterium mageritense]|uniref:class II aldolase/adducin family protein n=1 Tax=Mycolicibacterium mageritense TaxID=53462 RepID=UPI0035B5D4F3